MNEIILLMKIEFLKIFSPLINFKSAKKDKSEKRKALAWLLLIPSFIWLFIIIFKIVDFFYDAYSSIHQTEAVFPVLALTLTVFIFINIIPYSLSRLYYNKEFKNILHLPIKSENIIRSSMLFLSLSQILILIAFFLPAFIRYKRTHDFSFLYYIINFLNLSFYTVSTVCVIMFLWILVMRAFSRFKASKNILQFVMMFVFLIFIVSFQQLSKPMFDTRNAANSMQSFNNHIKPYLDGILSYAPHLKSLIKPIIDFTTFNAIIAIIKNLSIMLLLLAILPKIAFKPWLVGYNNAQMSDVKKIKKEDIDKYVKFKEHSIVMSLVKKELLNIIKIPVFFFNILLGGIIVPLVMMTPLLLDSTNRARILNLQSVSTICHQYNITSFNLIAILLLIGMIMGAFFSLSGSSTSTSITREGKQIWLMQSLPISLKEQVFSRLVAGAIFSLIESMPIVILLLFLFKAQLYYGIFLILGILASSLAINSYSMLIDIIRPKLNWKEPQGAVKNNFNIFLCILIDLGYIVLNILLFIFIFSGSIITLDNFYLYALGLILANILIAFIFYKINIKVLKSKISKYSV